jgi:16S rRNA (uracil1498-N3)-methyltransferase
LPKPTTVVITIGAEGGFSQNEVALALKHSFKNIYLGARILRAETAAIATLSIIKTMYNNWV